VLTIVPGKGFANSLIFLFSDSCQYPLLETICILPLVIANKITPILPLLWVKSG